MAIAFIASSAASNNINSASTAGPVTVGSGVNPTVGHMVMVSVSWVSSSVTSSTVTDTLGNSWTRQGSFFNSNDNTRMEMWTSKISTGGSATTYQAAFSASVGFPEIIAGEYSNATGTWVFVGYHAAGATSSPSSSGNVTFSGPGNAVFLSTNAQNNISQAGESGWAVRILNTINGFDDTYEDLIVTTTTTAAGTCTGNFTSITQQLLVMGDTAPALATGSDLRVNRRSPQFPPPFPTPGVSTLNQGILTPVTPSVTTAKVYPSGWLDSDFFGAMVSAPFVYPSGADTGEGEGASFTSLGVLPGGASSEEKEGASTIALSIQATGIASREHFGADASVPSILPAGIETGERQGSHIAAFAIFGAGLDIGEAWGAFNTTSVALVYGVINAQQRAPGFPLGAPIPGIPLLGTGTLVPASFSTIYPLGWIDADSLFGAPFSGLTIYPAGSETKEGFGNSTGALGVVPAGVDRSETVGSGTDALVVAHVGIDRLENFGAGQDSLGVHPAGVDRSEALGADSASIGVLPSGIDRLEDFGAGVDKPTLAPAGVDRSEVVGASTDALVVSHVGIDRLEDFGAGVDKPTLAPSGVDRSEVLGAGTNSLVFVDSGISSQETSGAGTNALVVSHVGIDRLEGFGAGVDKPILTPSGVAPGDVVGPATLGLISSLYPSGLFTEEKFGPGYAIPALAPSGTPDSSYSGAQTISVNVAPYGVVTFSDLGAVANVLTMAPAGIPFLGDTGATWIKVLVSPSGVPTFEASGAGVAQLVLTTQPSGIPTGEIVSAAGTIVPQVQPSGVSSAENLGTSWLSVGVDSTGFATLEVVGSGVTQPVVTVQPAGTPTGEVVSSGTIVPQLSPSGTASGEASGSDLVSVNILPSGVSVEEREGASSLLPLMYQSGVAPTEALGAGYYTLVTTPSGVPTFTDHGSDLVSLSVVPTGTSTLEAFGAQTATPVVSAHPSSIDTAEVVGAGTAVPLLQAAGISTLSDAGAEFLTLILSPSGTGSSEGFGVSVSVPVGLILAPIGTSTEEQVGSSSIKPMISASAIAPTEASGVPQVSLAVRTFVESLEAEGALVTWVYVYPSAISTAESTGTEGIAPGIYASSAPTEERLGPSLLVPVALVQPSSISSSEVVGGGTAMLFIQPTGTPASEVQGASVALLKMFPAGMDNPETIGLMTVLPVLRISPAGAEPHGGVGYGVAVPSVQPSSTVSEGWVGSEAITPFIAPSGAESQAGNFGSETLILWVGGTLFPSGAPSLEVIGSAVLSLTRPPPFVSNEVPLTITKQFRWGYPFTLGDLTLYIVDPNTRQPVSPAEISYTMYQIGPTGSMVQVGPPGKRPVKQNAGLYYATGIAGENGQPGNWVIRWRYRHSFRGSIVTVDYPFQVVDAVSGPISGDQTPRVIKYGWD